MIRFIIGLPGGGKTYFNLRFIVMELLNSDRWIVTNLTEIIPERLQAYMDKKYPHWKGSVAERVQFIDKTLTRQWYRFRGSYTLPEFDHGTKEELPEVRDARIEAYFSLIHSDHAEAVAVRHGKQDRGCVYFLDEGHRHFRAEEWGKMAHVGMFYISQLRHLNDVFWVTTQFPEQVVIQLRRIAQDTHLTRNHYLESFMLWKKSGGFKWRAFYGCPESKDKNAEGYDEGKVTLDLKGEFGLAKCYLTRGALKGRSELAEIKAPSKKLPYWTIYAFAGTAILAVFLILQCIPGAAGYLTDHLVAGFMGAAHNTAHGATKTKQPDNPKAEDEPVTQLLPKERPPSQTPPAKRENFSQNSTDIGETPQSQVKVAFYMIQGGHAKVMLTNGVVLRESDGVIRAITSDFVVLADGRRIYFQNASGVPRGTDVAGTVPQTKVVSVGTKFVPKNSVDNGQSGSQSLAKVTNGLPDQEKQPIKIISHERTTTQNGVRPLSRRASASERPANPVPGTNEARN